MLGAGVTPRVWLVRRAGPVLEQAAPMEPFPKAWRPSWVLPCLGPWTLKCSESPSTRACHPHPMGEAAEAGS